MKHFVGILIITMLMGSVAAHAQVRGEYLITNYGAKGDGSFDNAPIINSLINSLPTYGGSIVIPHGDFRINSNISIPAGKNYVTIRGLGRGSRIILGTGAGAGIDVPSDPVRISGLTIRDLRISGSDWSVYQTGILVSRFSDGAHFNNVICDNLKTGIFMNGSDAPRIVSCWVEQCESAIRLTGGLNQLVCNNHFGGYSGGVTCEFAGLNHLQFTGNVIVPDGYTCVWLNGSDNCNIAGNTITTWYTGAIVVQGNMNTVVGNNLKADLVNSSWLPDPHGRDGLYGLIFVSGNDNLIASDALFSWQPINDTRVNINSGDRNILRDLTIAANDSNKKIVVGGANATRITHCGYATEIQPNGSTHITYDP